jgi:hypothetical protein
MNGGVMRKTMLSFFFMTMLFDQSPVSAQAFQEAAISEITKIPIASNMTSAVNDFDEAASKYLVYLLIVAIYALYWARQKV